MAAREDSKSYREAVVRADGSASYWDYRYNQKHERTNSVYEWYCGFKELEPYFSPHMKESEEQNHRLLHVGCGNSALGVDIGEHYENLTVENCDYSEVCIEKMKERFPETDSLKWKYINMLEDVNELGIIFFVLSVNFSFL